MNPTVGDYVRYAQGDLFDNPLLGLCGRVISVYPNHDKVRVQFDRPNNQEPLTVLATKADLEYANDKT